MNIWKSEMLARSKAGHDKDDVFVVLSCDGTYCMLADGKSRTLEKPKKKKIRHVQVIKNLPEELLNLMQQIEADAHVRKILKEYRNMQNMNE